MDPGLHQYIENIFKSLEQNTMLEFDAKSRGKADLVVGATKKAQHIGVNEMSWGLSVGFDFSAKSKPSLLNKYTAAVQIAMALGVSDLPEKTKGIYSFEDSIAAWPLSNDISDNFGITSSVGLTISDFDALNHAWSAFL